MTDRRLPTPESIADTDTFEFFRAGILHDMQWSDMVANLTVSGGGGGLPTDGTGSMTGDLEMGGNNINDAGDVLADTLTLNGVLVSVNPVSGTNIAKTYATVAAMIAATDLAVGQTAVTQGYTSAGDGGAGVYRIVAAATGINDGGFYHDLTGITGQAELVHAGRWNARQFGTVGDGVTDDSDALNRATGSPWTQNGNNMPDSGVLELHGDDTYLLKSSIYVNPKLEKIVGNGATLKRCDALTTTTTAVVNQADTAIPVTSVSALGVQERPTGGERLVLVNTAATYGGRSDREHGGGVPRVTTIVGNTINIDLAAELPDDGSLDGAGEWPIGTTVLKSFAMLFNDDTIKLDLDNIVFDGNRDNNTVNNGWIVNVGISKASGVISNCVFKNMPNETMFASVDTTLVNNDAYDLNGSFVHISSGELARNIIDGNRIRNCCEVGRDISTHSEGAITFSSQAGKTVISNNIVFGSGQGFCGNGAESGVVMTGNYAENCEGIIAINVPTALRKADVVISGNVFKTCGAFLIHQQSGAAVEDGYGLDGISITGNEFKNCRIWMEYASNININGNAFLWEDGYSPGAEDFTIGSESIDGATYQIKMTKCLRYNISDNTFEDQGATVNEITTPIQLEIASTPVKIKTDALTETDYLYYNRDCVVSNNVLTNYANGINCSSAIQGATWSLIGMNIDGNVITLKDTADSSYGIRAMPGVVAKGNTIVCNSNTDDGIYLRGVLNTKNSSINGEVIIGNAVLGNPTRSIRVGLGTGTTDDQNRSWNMTVINNVTDVAIEDNNPSQNVVSGNVQNKVTSTTFPLQATRANSGWY